MLRAAPVSGPATSPKATSGSTPAIGREVEMLRRVFFLSFFASALTADPREEVYDLFGSMASALSEGDTGRFLAAFDPSMKGYEDLAANVRALIDQADVTSTIEPV